MKINEDLTINGANKTLKTLNAEVENLKPYVLYDNATGAGSTATLSDSTSNYTYLEVYYRANDSAKHIGYTKVYNPNGCTISMVFFHLASQTYIKIGEARITDNKITMLEDTIENYYSWSGNATISTQRQSAYHIKIVRVVGYK